MKKTIKEVLIIMITVFSIFSLTMPFTYASSIGDIFSKADEFIETGKKDADEKISTTNLQEMSNLLYNVLLIIGIVIAVGVGIFIGIQFITGSIEIKAKVKETLVPYIAGCIIIFGAFTIWKIVVTLGNSIEGSKKITIEEASKITTGIINGTINVANLPDNELRAAFNNNEIARDIGTKVNRGGMSVSEAVNSLSDYKKEIYNECKRRGLLSDSGKGLKSE